MPFSGCFASASAAAAAVRASSICRGDILRRAGLHAAVTGRAIDVDHRGGVLVRCEGERAFPVEGILGGHRLVERSRTGGRVVAFLAPEPKAVTCLKRPAFDQCRPSPAAARPRP